MKTARVIIGIISIVLVVVVLFQSCAAGISNAIEDNGETSGSSGVFLAILMLIAGIISIATRKSAVGGIIAGAFYALGGLSGISNYGSYSDLKIWAVMNFIFAAICIIGSIITKPKKHKDETNENK